MSQDPPPEPTTAAELPPLDEATAPREPLALFRAWVERALATDPEGATTMTLATADTSGRPSARMVLLKGFDERGFTFFTNYSSRKARELEVNPRASLLFYWPRLSRQVRIEGPVARVTPAESDAYFATRPRGSQLGALASRQSEPVAGRGPLEDRFAALEAELAGRPVPRPPGWGGYLLVHEAVEFWHGRPDRLHDRLRYAADGRGWSLSRLEP